MPHCPRLQASCVADAERDVTAFKTLAAGRNEQITRLPPSEYLLLSRQLSTCRVSLSS